jgi:hypothetical protein
MSNFHFKQQSNRVESLVQSSLQILDSYSEPEIKNLLEDFNQFWNEYQNQPKLTIAFIGQYNAGKSTLIKALTGDPAVRISAEICTNEVTEYSWKDVLVVDTPGIYAGRTDHDSLTLEKISRSDLLVFVVPNELFNPQGGDFFKKIANDMQRVGQMVLVINKMSREIGEPETLLSSILQVIEPYHYNDFHTCFIDADSYLQARHETDEEEKTFLVGESNFDNFLNALQKLIERNELSAKLVTPLHKAVDLLDKSYNLLAANDQLTRDLLELLRRKENILRASQIRSKNIYRSILNELEYEIIMLAEQVASKLNGYHSEEEINKGINNSEQGIDSLVKLKITEIGSSITIEMTNLETKLQELEGSLLGKKIKREIEIELQHKKKQKNYDLNESGSSTYLKAAPEILQGVGKFASQASRDIVYSVGKSLGVKFKPWGAFKAANFIRGLGPVLAGLGFALDIVLSNKEEEDKRNFEQQLIEMRAKIRKDYRDLALQIKNTYEVNISSEIQFYDEELKDIESQKEQLRNSDETKKKVVDQINQQIKQLKQEVSNLTKIALSF